MYSERDLRRSLCEVDSSYFARYFFKQRMSQKMLVAPHHRLILDTLDRTTLDHDHPDHISRLIINIPPGYSKTEIAVINYMARGLSINPQARFLHLSYSHKLALKNSADARNIVKSESYQSMWPVVIRDDADSKEIWHTEDGGGVVATSSGGQVTGFRAGHISNKFSGSLVIDDPVKPDDAYSEVIREGVNNNYNETIASRVAIETVPIIVIMQRIHWNDLSGYLLNGGSGEKWHHLNLPVILGGKGESYTHAIPIDHKLPSGWLWPVKHDDKNEIALRAHRRRFAAQYMQSPIKRDEETALWKESSVKLAREKYKKGRKSKRVLVSIDPAASNTKNSDEHGIGVSCIYDDNDYGVLADYTRKGSPTQWAHAAIEAYDVWDADAIVIETNQGGDMCIDTLRNAGYTGKIIEVKATKGKTIRAEPIAALYELGYVSHNTGLSLLEDEMLDFDPLSGKSNGKSPNRVDWLVWALTELSGKQKTNTLDVWDWP